MMNLGDRMKQDQNRVEQLRKIERSLTNVTPTQEGIERIEQLRDKAKQLATAIVFLTDVSREQSLAITHLETAVMFAVKSIVLEGEGN